MSANPTDVPRKSSSWSSVMVAGGILLSRVSGLVRERVFAQFFGTSLYADVFRAALRMPNVLQNLLGEGTLSASFIPVYSELIGQGRKKEAGRVAGAIFSLLLAIAGALAIVGSLAAPLLVDVLLVGFTGERRTLTIQVVQILFPMTGVLVMSAWSLGILNSHRHFFIPYVAPVLWNAAMIATMLILGGTMPPGDLVVALGWGALVGGVLQVGVQLPSVIRLERELKIRWDLKLQGVRDALRNAGPAILGRGVVQLSGWLDMVLASLLAVGGVAAVGYAQTIYMLPVSLFGMSIAAAELPELARQRTGAMDVLRDRTNRALERVAFFVVPSAVCFLALGDVAIAGLYQTGRFDAGDTRLVHLTLAGYTLGLIASTSTRLFSSAFYALRDTRTPARVASIRVAVSAVLGFVFMTQFEGIRIEKLGLDLPAGWLSEMRVGTRQLGAVGLSTGTALAAWLEWGLLKRALQRQLGTVGAGTSSMFKMVLAALIATAAGWGLKLILPAMHPLLCAVLVLSVFGAGYLGAAWALGLQEVHGIVDKVKRKLGRKPRG